MRTLKAIVNWLDKRFPEKVIITLSEFNSLYETLGSYNQYLQALNKKLEALEAKVNAPSPVNTLKEDIQVIVDNQDKAIKSIKDEIGKLQIVMGFSRGSATLER